MAMTPLAAAEAALHGHVFDNQQQYLQVRDAVAHVIGRYADKMEDALSAIASGMVKNSEDMRELARETLSSYDV